MNVKYVAQLDLILAHQDWLHKIKDIEICKILPLQSQHFLVLCHLDVVIQKIKPIKQRSVNLQALRNPEVAKEFSSSVISRMSQIADSQDCEEYNRHHTKSISEVSSSFLPSLCMRQRNPWVASSTLELLDQYHFARQLGNYALEKELNAVAKKNIKEDKTQWIKSIAATGDFKQIRTLRKLKAKQQCRLMNSNGELVFSDQRAETLADHLQNIQWAVHPCAAIPTGDPLGPTLNVDEKEISEEEVREAIAKLKNRKASGPDGIVGEYFKALARTPSGLNLIVELCRLCWESKALPSSWKISRVTLIFKKGDPASCENSRPISLLAIGYKLIASIVLKRIQNAGAEDRIWKSQFGFRRHRGTTDALFAARRLLDLVWDSASHSCAFLALDWAKAFDSISPDALCQSLSRFGLPASVVSLVRSIYSSREFFVRDSGIDSDIHQQHYGISQGRPLSPFLFTIVMTMLLSDAQSELKRQDVTMDQQMPFHDLLYADDTLLIDMYGHNLSKDIVSLQ